MSIIDRLMAVLMKIFKTDQRLNNKTLIVFEQLSLIVLVDLEQRLEELVKHDHLQADAVRKRLSQSISKHLEVFSDLQFVLNFNLFSCRPICVH